MIKVLAVFGTRPEAIKMCPLVMALNGTKNIECRVCLTAQHREMLDQVIEVFGISADYDLNIMKPNQTLTDITIEVLNNLNGIIQEENPDLILVHGDTTTSFAAALSAFYHQIPVGHVEAGLRTYDMRSPYPEEFNRQAVDLITEMYFAPTENAKRNLIKEGKCRDKIYVTGNTVIDALSTTVKSDFEDENLRWAFGCRLIICTAHRRENIGESMGHMFMAIKRIAEEYEDVRIIYPVHKNPKVLEMARKVLGGISNIRLIEPLDAITFHNYMNKSYLILTDSGGIQEEAPALGKPVLVMRDTTERPEGVEAGTLKLVGTDEEMIYREVRRLLDDSEVYHSMSKALNPYGDGHASERIVEIIENYFNKERSCLLKR